MMVAVVAVHVVALAVTREELEAVVRWAELAG